MAPPQPETQDGPTPDGPSSPGTPQPGVAQAASSHLLLACADATGMALGTHGREVTRFGGCSQVKGRHPEGSMEASGRRLWDK